MERSETNSGGPEVGLAQERRTGSRFTGAGQVLRVRAFRWWFSSQVLSASGSMTQNVAQSWLVLKLTGSALLLALTATVAFAPSLFGGALAGL